MSQNPAYETKTLLHTNPAYEGNPLHTQSGDRQQTKTEMATPEPTYEIIPQAINQPSDDREGVTGDGEEYDKLNRTIPNMNTATAVD